MLERKKYKSKLDQDVGESLQNDGKQCMCIIPLSWLQWEENLDTEQQLESRYVLTDKSTIVENWKEPDCTKQWQKVVLHWNYSQYLFSQCKECCEPNWRVRCHRLRIPHSFHQTVLDTNNQGSLQSHWTKGGSSKRWFSPPNTNFVSLSIVSMVNLNMGM